MKHEPSQHQHIDDIILQAFHDIQDSFENACKRLSLISTQLTDQQIAALCNLSDSVRDEEGKENCPYPIDFMISGLDRELSLRWQQSCQFEYQEICSRLSDEKSLGPTARAILTRQAKTIYDQSMSIEKDIRSVESVHLSAAWRYSR